MTETRALLISVALLAAVAVAPQLRAQTACPEAARNIWFDGQRDAASGVQTVRDVRVCLDGVLISAAQAEIVGDDMVIRNATVSIPREVLATFSRGSRTVYRGDQLRDLPQP